MDCKYITEIIEALDQGRRVLDRFVRGEIDDGKLDIVTKIFDEAERMVGDLIKHELSLYAIFLRTKQENWRLFFKKIKDQNLADLLSDQAQADLLVERTFAPYTIAKPSEGRIDTVFSALEGLRDTQWFVELSEEYFQPPQSEQIRKLLEESLFRVMRKKIARGL